MSSTISFNPFVTTGVSGAFLVATGGYVQGSFIDNPANRFQLQNGYVSSSQSTPLWGGLPVTLAIPNTDQPEVGPGLVLAGSLSGINAWTLFNMSAAGVITSSSNVPLYSSNTSLNYALAGSNVQVALPINPSVLSSLEGEAPNTDLYWDPTNLRLDTSSGGSTYYGPLPLSIEALSNTSKTVSYNGGTGVATWNDSGSVALCRI